MERDDARVAVLEQAGQIFGFFPFQITAFRRARPIALALSDYQGIIAQAGVDFDVLDLLRMCRLRSFEFDHLLVGQRPFTQYHQSRGASPVMDLRGGYEEYCQSRRNAGSKQILKLGTLRRKLERELGDVRFELASEPSRVLASVFTWKSRQCVESGGTDFFALSWTRALIERLVAVDVNSFAGTLSALWAGDQLLAVHMGMRSDRVWHYWFPGYAREFAQYSPGLLLLLEMARACRSLGLDEIDLGKGEGEYKQRLATHEIPVAQGIVETPGLSRMVNEACRRADKWAGRTRWARAATIPGRFLRRVRRPWRYG